MAESTRQKDRDHSKFDNMSTAELNEYLRQDSYCEDSNLDDILYVMEVLERREKEDGNYSPPDVQKAWAEFQKYYNTEDNDGKPLHDFDDEDDDEPTAEIISIKKARKGLNRSIKSIISVAAVLCVILAGSVTAKALGYDIWDAIIVWTKDTFGFETTVNEPKPSEYVKQIPEELVDLKNLMTEHSLSDELIPSYIPDGYKILNLQYADLADADSIFCQLSTGSNDIMLMYNAKHIGIIIEVKYAENDNLEAECANALKQIEKLHYVDALSEFDVTKVYKYAIACYRKHCMVTMTEENWKK